MQECDNPISTFLVDAKEYQDLTERARLNDLRQEEINILRRELDALKNDYTAYRDNRDSELQDIIAKANARVDARMAAFDALGRTIESQNRYIEVLENRLDNAEENLSILYDLVAKLKRNEPGQTAQDRAARIDHYMDARPDHKASYEALKGFLGINDVLLNSAIAALKKEHPGKYGTSKDSTDKRKRILAVIPKIS